MSQQNNFNQVKTVGFLPGLNHNYLSIEILKYFSMKKLVKTVSVLSKQARALVYSPIFIKDITVGLVQEGYPLIKSTTEIQKLLSINQQFQIKILDLRKILIIEEVKPDHQTFFSQGLRAASQGLEELYYPYWIPSKPIIEELSRHSFPQLKTLHLPILYNFDFTHSYLDNFKVQCPMLEEIGFKLDGLSVGIPIDKVIEENSRITSLDLDFYKVVRSQERLKKKKVKESCMIQPKTYNRLTELSIQFSIIKHIKPYINLTTMLTECTNLKHFSFEKSLTQMTGAYEQVHNTGTLKCPIIETSSMLKNLQTLTLHYCFPTDLVLQIVGANLKLQKLTLALLPGEPKYITFPDLHNLEEAQISYQVHGRPVPTLIFNQMDKLTSLTLNCYFKFYRPLPLLKSLHIGSHCVKQLHDPYDFKVLTPKLECLMLDNCSFKSDIIKLARVKRLGIKRVQYDIKQQKSIQVDPNIFQVDITDKKGKLELLDLQKAKNLEKLYVDSKSLRTIQSKLINLENLTYVRINTDEEVSRNNILWFSKQPRITNLLIQAEIKEDLSISSPTIKQLEIENKNSKNAFTEIIIERCPKLGYLELIGFMLCKSVRIIECRKINNLYLDSSLFDRVTIDSTSCRKIQALNVKIQTRVEQISVNHYSYVSMQNVFNIEGPFPKLREFNCYIVTNGNTDMYILTYIDGKQLIDIEGMDYNEVGPTQSFIEHIQNAGIEAPFTFEVKDNPMKRYLTLRFGSRKENDIEYKYERDDEDIETDEEKDDGLGEVYLDGEEEALQNLENDFEVMNPHIDLMC